MAQKNISRSKSAAPFSLEFPAMKIAGDAGAVAAVEYFNGNYESLDSFITDYMTGDARARACGSHAIAGYMVQAAVILETAQKGGKMTISPVPPSPSQVSYLLSRGVDLLSEPLQTLSATMKAIKKEFPGMWFGAQVSEKPVEPPKEEKPQRIEIVSMPVRESIQSVERDAEQEILRTISTERDI